MEDLQRVYSLLSNEITKAQHKIDGIDRILDYWCDARTEAVTFLNGIQQARDIVWKELHK